MREAKLYLFLLLIISLLSLTGCWGMRETDEIAYVLMVGFDKGERDNLVLTLSIANPKTATGGGEGGGGDEETIREVVSVEAYGPLVMLDLLSTTIDRHVYLQHAKAFVFSEELAREGLEQWLSPLMRFRETRGAAQIFICRGKARDLIQKNNPFLGLGPAKQIELIRKMSETHGLFPVTQLIDLYL
ncbi:MAG: Ger(x)C family spore germination protein, partial [Desulfotomaculaceae bacterium]|nr:Ger(x)C family spore germination protein [Desulfotomaculaceae bacterium]